MRYIKISRKEKEKEYDLTYMLVDRRSDEALDEMVKRMSSSNLRYYWEEVTLEEYNDFYLNF